MTELHHDHGDEVLDRLYRALARSRANTQALEEAIAEYEGTPTAEVHRRRRAMMRGVPVWIPIIAGGVGATIQWAAKRRKAVALVAASNALTAAAVVLTWPDHDQAQRPRAEPPRPSTSATAPARTGQPSRTASPRPPTTAEIPPALTGQLPTQSDLPTSDTAQPPALPPAAAEPPPSAAPSPSPAPPNCLLDLERPITLRLLCRTA